MYYLFIKLVSIFILLSHSFITLVITLQAFINSEKDFVLSYLLYKKLHVSKFGKGNIAAVDLKVLMYGM